MLIKLSKKEDFIRLAKYTKAKGYDYIIVYTVFQVYLIPRVASRHRHTYFYEGTEEDIQSILKEVQGLTFEIYEGEVKAVTT